MSRCFCCVASESEALCCCSQVVLDGVLLFVARALRMTAYGWTGVVLYKYLAAIGFSEADTGLLLTCVLVGDLLMSLLLTTRADRFGRRRSLMLGALLMLMAGVAFALSTNFYVLATAGVVGVISPTGGEIGPFLAVEQAALTQLLQRRSTKTTVASVTTVFACFNFVGSLAIALGSLVGGLTVDELRARSFSDADAYRSALFAYSGLALIMMLMYALLSARTEPTPPSLADLRESTTSTTPSLSSSKWLSTLTGLKTTSTRVVVAKMSALFIIDAFGAGFVMQTLIAFWLAQRWGVAATLTGVVLLACNCVAGFSALLAAPLAKRFGLVNTIVFTHLPSNVFLLLVPLMPSSVWAMVFIVARFSISQLDVPARQALVVLVVPADERAAASGITTVMRSIGLAISPALSSIFLAHAENSLLFGASFFMAGGVMILYDILLWIALRRVQPIDANDAGKPRPTVTETVTDVPPIFEQ